MIKSECFLVLIKAFYMKLQGRNSFAASADLREGGQWPLADNLWPTYMQLLMKRW